MAKKEQAQAPEELELEVDTSTVNEAPQKVYNSFDEFFHEFALANNINLKWKDSVKKHLQAIGCFKQQDKWLDGIRHFGL